MKQIFIPLLVFFAVRLQGREATSRGGYYRVAISNSHTAKPLGSFVSLLYKEFHAGGELSRGKILHEKKKHQWLAEMTLSYLYHRWVQQNLAMSINGGYRRSIATQWGAVAKLGVGYQVSIPTGKVYSITGEGLEEKGHIIRSQVMAAVSVAADKKFNKKGAKVFMEYQQKIQAPFINEYVPLLPYNTLLLGVRLPVR